MKHSSSKRKLVPVLVFAVLAFAAPPAAGDTGDSATGSGTNEAGDSFEFSATGGPGDSATGTMTYTAPGITATAAVDCLVVVGNAATVGGTITASNIPDFVGDDLFFSVEDNGVLGSPAADNFEEAFHEDPLPCIDPFGGFPLTVGEIVVVAGGGDDEDDDDQGEDDDDQGEDDDDQGEDGG